MRIRHLALVAAAVVAATAGTAAPANAAPETCVAIGPAVPTCTFQSSGGYVTVECATTGGCSVRTATAFDSCNGVCIAQIYTTYGQIVTVRVSGVGVAVADGD